MIDRHAHLKDRELYKLIYNIDLTPRVIDFAWRNEPRVLWVLKWLSPWNSVVDIGCAKGVVTIHIWLKVTGRVLGVDISETQIRDARGFCQQENVDTEWLVGDAEDLPIMDSSFDVAVVTELLEHVIDPAKVIAEAERVVKNHGLVVVSSPKDAIAMDRESSDIRDETYGYKIDMHVREYDPEIELRGKPSLVTDRGNLGDRVFYLAKYEVVK